MFDRIVIVLFKFFIEFRYGFSWEDFIDIGSDMVSVFFSYDFKF